MTLQKIIDFINSQPYDTLYYSGFSHIPNFAIFNGKDRYSYNELVLPNDVFWQGIVMNYYNQKIFKVCSENDKKAYLKNTDFVIQQKEFSLICAYIKPNAKNSKVSRFVFEPNWTSYQKLRQELFNVFGEKEANAKFILEAKYKNPLTEKDNTEVYYIKDFVYKVQTDGMNDFFKELVFFFNSKRTTLDYYILTNFKEKLVKLQETLNKHNILSLTKGGSHYACYDLKRARIIPHNYLFGIQDPIGNYEKLANGIIDGYKGLGWWDTQINIKE